MKKLCVFIFLLICIQQLPAQFNYKLKDYNSDIRSPRTLDKSIRVNDIMVDTTWFFNYQLTNTRVYADAGTWVAISEENIESLSDIVRTNISGAGFFSAPGENETDPDYELNTILLFWNSSLSAKKIYTGLGAFVELVNQDGEVVWNQNYYFEEASTFLKRKAVVKQFIDHLLKDLISLDLDHPYFRKINVDQDKEQGCLVVFYTNSEKDIKKAIKVLDRTEKADDLPLLPGNEYICSFKVFYFRGPHLFAVNTSFDIDDDPETIEDQHYRENYLDEHHNLTTVIDSSLNDKVNIWFALDQIYKTQFIEESIKEYSRRDSVLQETELELKTSGSQEDLLYIQEEREKIGQIIADYHETGIISEEIMDLRKEIFFLRFEESMIIYKYARQKAFKYFE